MAEKASNSIQRAYLLMGGNLGRPEQQLLRARQLIHARCGAVLLSSSMYSTAAWGPIEQPPFLNQSLILSTHLSPTLLMTTLLAIEEEMGRVRTEKMGPRTIDIDILLLDQQILDLPELKVPHPLLPQRKFALMPLEEIAPFLVHPVLKKNIRQLLNECNDPGDVQKKAGWLGE